MSESKTPIELAKEFIAETDQRAQVKVQLCVNGWTQLAGLLDEAVIVSQELLRVDAELAAMTERAEKAEAAKREAVEEIVERCAQLVINRVINRTMHTIHMNKLVADIRALPIEKEGE